MDFGPNVRYIDGRVIAESLPTNVVADPLVTRVLLVLLQLDESSFVFAIVVEYVDGCILENCFGDAVDIWPVLSVWKEVLPGNSDIVDENVATELWLCTSENGGDGFVVEWTAELLGL